MSSAETEFTLGYRSDVDPSALARAFRGLVLWFGASLLLNIVFFTLSVVPVSAELGAVVAMGNLLSALFILIMLAIYGYRTALELDSSVALLWGIAIVVPVLNVVVLLGLNAKAKRVCREHGIPVGLLGPDLSAVDRTVIRDGG